MRAKDLLNKFAERERDFREREFLAPFTPASKTAIVKLDNVNYEFRIISHKGSGFGIFRPVDHDCARFIREASYEEVRPYLDVLPKVNLTLCYEADQGWVGFPMNLESAKKSIGLDGEIVIKNVSDAERFDTVTVRYDGVHFWFDEVFTGADVVKSDEMRERFDPKSDVKKMRESLASIKGLTPEDRKSFDLMLASWKLFTTVSTEEHIRATIESGGGKLGKYVLRGDLVEIRWKSPSGESYTSVVKKGSLDVVSAGICLSGEDKKFHLKDLPFIIEQGEQRDLIYRMGHARAFDMDGDDEYED